MRAWFFGLEGLGQERSIYGCAETYKYKVLTGSVESLSAEDIINGWIKAGWVVLSPNRVEIRVTQTGEEQLDKWKEDK